MNTTEFRPSSIRNLVVCRGDFGRAESECAAVIITTVLSSTDAPWETELSNEGVVACARNTAHPHVHEIYKDMIEVWGVPFVIDGLRFLLEDGYITRTRSDRDNNVTFFKVTDKFIEVMQRFVTS